VRFKYTGNWDWWWALDNVLVYEPQPQTLVYCTAKVNSKGCLPAIAFSGTPSASLAQPFTISASNVINNKAGLFIYSLSGRDNLPFQGGILCLQQPIRRTTPQVSAGNPPPDDCSGSYAIDFNAWIQSGIDPLLVPGRMVDGQYWSRDPASPSGTGLSDAVEFVIGL